MSLKDYSRFIYFHPNTKGENGKAVYIDRALIGPFLDLVDTQAQRGRDIANQINALKDLKTVAGDINSNTNISRAGLNQSMFGPLMVEYFIFQDKTELNRGPGVYIQDIRAIEYAEGGRSQRKAGLYLVENFDGWVIRRAAQKMETTVGAIGAHYDGAQFSSEDSASLYGKYIHKAGKNQQDKFCLYYSPGYIINSLGCWFSAEQKQLPSGESQKIFANVLADSLPWSESSSVAINYRWFVFEDGIKFLQEALEEFKRQVFGKPVQTLSEHEFYLVNPKGSVGPLLNMLSELKANIPRKGSYHFDANAIAAKFSLVANQGSMIEGLQAHGCDWQAIDKISDPIAQKYQGLMNGVNPDTTFFDLVRSMISNIKEGWA